MSISSTSADDVTRFLTKHTPAFLTGIAIGSAIAWFLGWHFGSSGVIETDARAKLLTEERDKYKQELAQTKGENEELTLELAKTRTELSLSQGAVRELQNTRSEIEVDHQRSLQQAEEANVALGKKYKALESKFLESRVLITDTADAIAFLREQNTELRHELAAATRPPPELADGAKSVLVHLFGKSRGDKVADVAKSLDMAPGMVQYHIDVLKRVGLARTELSTHCYLTEKGRAYVVDEGLSEQ